MNERIKQLAISTGIYDSLCDPYDRHNTGNPVGSIIDDLEKFAELIVKESALTAALMEHKGRKNIGAAILDRFEIPNNSNVMSGAEQMSDGGYELSTKEKYDKAVKQREESLRNRSTYFGID